MDRPTGLLRRDGLTLLMSLGMAYLLVTATLPALLDRREMQERRQAVEAEVTELAEQVRTLQEWHEAAQHDPLVRERLRETWRLAPDAPGYRVEDAPPGDAGPR